MTSQTRLPRSGTTGTLLLWLVGYSSLPHIETKESYSKTIEHFSNIATWTVATLIWTALSESFNNYTSGSTSNDSVVCREVSLTYCRYILDRSAASALIPLLPWSYPPWDYTSVNWNIHAKLLESWDHISAFSPLVEQGRGTSDICVKTHIF